MSEKLMSLLVKKLTTPKSLSVKALSARRAASLTGLTHSSLVTVTARKGVTMDSASAVRNAQI